MPPSRRVAWSSRRARRSSVGAVHATGGAGPERGVDRARRGHRRRPGLPRGCRHPLRGRPAPGRHRAGGAPEPTGESHHGGARPRRSRRRRPAARYRSAGVDIEAGNRAVALLSAAVASTRTPNVLSAPGTFGGLYSLAGLDAEHVLVASTDGVGTKAELAARHGRRRGIGVDLVNHCIGDIAVHGARPLFFLDYIAMSRLLPEAVAEIVSGMADACREAGCALLGGETAEMPGVYVPGGDRRGRDHRGSGPARPALAPPRDRAGRRRAGGDRQFGAAHQRLLAHPAPAGRTARRLHRRLADRCAAGASPQLPAHRLAR